MDRRRKRRRATRWFVAVLVAAFVGLLAAGAWLVDKQGTPDRRHAEGRIAKPPAGPVTRLKLSRTLTVPAQQLARN